jgi:hypothetical protein
MKKENSGVSINSILQKAKAKGRNLKSKKSQDYSQKPNEIVVS